MSNLCRNYVFVVFVSFLCRVCVVLCRFHAGEKTKLSRNDLPEVLVWWFVLKSASVFTLNPMVMVLRPKTKQQIQKMSKTKFDVPATLSCWKATTSTLHVIQPLQLQKRTCPLQRGPKGQHQRGIRLREEAAAQKLYRRGSKIVMSRTLLQPRSRRKFGDTAQIGKK